MQDPSAGFVSIMPLVDDLIDIISSQGTSGTAISTVEAAEQIASKVCPISLNIHFGMETGRRHGCDGVSSLRACP